MKQLKYIGTHKPEGMIFDAEEKDVKRLLSSGEWKLLEENNNIIKQVEESKPDKKWKEMEIYDWIIDKKIPIKYKPASDSKNYILDKLEKGGYL